MLNLKKKIGCLMSEWSYLKSRLVKNALTIEVQYAYKYKKVIFYTTANRTITSMKKNSEMAIFIT